MPIYLFSKEPCNQNDNTVMYIIPYSNIAITYKNLYLPGE